MGSFHLADLFGGTTDLLKDAMSGAAFSHAAIANNVANVNTPNYRRVDVSFKEALAATEATPPDPDQLTLATTDAKHIPINAEVPPTPFHVEQRVDDNTTSQMRVDHSNVDVDQEMARLTQNSAYAQAMAQLLSTQYMRIRSAIEERA